MENIIFTNSKGQSIQLGNDGPFILTKIEGIGAVNVDIQSQKSPYQDGVSYLGNTLEPRSLSIEIMILADAMEEMIENRRNLIQVFNPKLDEGTLVYEIGGIRREIKAISELAPVFPENKDFKDTMQPGLIQLYCSDPFWLDSLEISEEITTWRGGLTFPLRLPTTFSMAGERIINVINKGDTSTPIRLEIHGPATNPKVLKRATGEFIKVNAKVLEGETLVITTAFGEKKVEINGENKFHYIDHESTFFNLEVGDNVIEASTEDETENTAFRITYRNRYLGV